MRGCDGRTVLDGLTMVLLDEFYVQKHKQCSSQLQHNWKCLGKYACPKEEWRISGYKVPASWEGTTRRFMSHLPFRHFLPIHKTHSIEPIHFHHGLQTL